MNHVPSGSVIPIPRERADEAVGVLALAFEHDPLMRYLLGGDDQREVFLERLREFFHFTCSVRFDLEWPLLGCVAGSRLVGVACVTEPAVREWPDSLISAYERLELAIGRRATRRFEAYSQLIDRHRPQQPNHYLAALGIHPQAEGRGYGRMLVDAVRALSLSHPSSIGVALDTENPDNVPFYERCGYHVIAQPNLDDLKIWCMFQPNNRASAAR